MSRRVRRIPHKLGKIHREGSLSKRGISFYGKLKSLWQNRPTLLKERRFSRKVDWKWIIIAFLVGIIVSSHANAAPEPSQPPKAPKIAILKPISAPKIKNLTKVAPIVVEAPKPVYVAPTPVINCGDNIYKQFIYQHESGCNTASVNAGGCAGLGQACPGTKLPCSLSDWACQDAYFTSYAISTYGSWENAYNAWLSKGWW